MYDAEKIPAFLLITFVHREGRLSVMGFPGTYGIFYLSYVWNGIALYPFLQEGGK